MITTIYNDIIEASVNPQHVEKGLMTDGFVLGGMSRRTLRNTYAQPSSSTATTSNNDRNNTATTSSIERINTASTVNSETVTAAGDNSNSNKISPYLTGSSASVIAQMTKKPEQKSHDNNNVAQSFIFNEQMSKIRQAEMVILAEEKKFGVLSKDPEGRLMPRLQALTRQAAHELKKDNYRPLIEPAHTASYAPHASNSDIGVAPPNWTPSMDTTTTAAAAYQHLTSGESNPNPINPNRVRVAFTRG